MKARNVTFGLLILFLLGGCVCVDGVNLYHFRGRLVNAHDGKPVAGAKIVGAIYVDHDPPRGSWKPDLPITDEQGNFDVSVGRLWGGLYPLILIPDSHTPDTLDRVAIYIGWEGKWQKRVVAVSKSQQSKATSTDRWIELGDLPYDPSGPFVTTRPNGE